MVTHDTHRQQHSSALLRVFPRIRKIVAAPDSHRHTELSSFRKLQLSLHPGITGRCSLSRFTNVTTQE
jgi:hypothetical protein